MSLLKALGSMASKVVKNAPIGSATLQQAANPERNPNRPGVYILRINGKVMKVGSAQIGVQKRMQQYFGLNSSCGLNKHINLDNRDQISVTWQVCTASQCNELESKLFDKYGDHLPWSERRPRSTSNKVKLVI